MNNQRGNRRQNNQNDDRNENALMVVQPPRLPMPPQAQQQGVTPGKWKALTDAVFPSAKSVDGVMLAVSYCEARKLDIMKKVVHIVPMWSTAAGREVETVWPGIAEARITATRTGQWAGTDECVFGRVCKQAFSETVTSNGGNNRQPSSRSASCPEITFPEWAQVTVYKIVAGVRVPFVGPKVRFLETFSGTKGLRVPNDRWRQAPYQMLEKCAEAAALRRAFPEELGDMPTAEEMEGKETNYQPKYANDGSVNETVEQQQERDDQQDQDDQQGQQQAGGSDGDEQDSEEYKAWVARYMTTMRAAVARFDSIEAFDAIWKKEQEHLDRLPPKQAKEAAQLEHDTRMRLDPAYAERYMREQQGDNVEDADFVDDKGEPEQQQGGDDEPAYLRNLRRRIAKVEFMIDLGSIENAEKRTIDELPDDQAAIARQMLADKRKQLAGE